MLYLTLRLLAWDRDDEVPQQEPEASAKAHGIRDIEEVEGVEGTVTISWPEKKTPSGGFLNRKSKNMFFFLNIKKQNAHTIFRRLN